MKKYLILGIMIFILGCANEENSLVKNNYINNKKYNEIYNDLSKIGGIIPLIK